ncbi:MAG TPA: carbonic anhydrase family protein [Rubrobacteraceae bacterium]|jgi:carbonic anhydrase|nr:carbonic anhydrase family protein [Rubrobacteraceae bacterium]
MFGKFTKLFGIVFILAVSITGVAFAEEAEWGYEGEIGPAYWGELSSDYATCATGTEQSPVDIPSSAPTDPANLRFDYQPTELNVVNDGHVFKTAYDSGSSLRVDGRDYKLEEFHFHNPSDHTIDGDAAPMGLHLVHKDDQGEVAVVDVSIVEGARNTALAPFFDNLPAAKGEMTLRGATIDAAEFLPYNQSYWRYDGSLTTPPCTEGVKWFVMTTPVEVSAEQIAAHNAIYSGNARPTQPMNGRPFFVGRVPSTTLAKTGGPELDGRLVSVIGVAGALLVLGATAGYSALWRRARR